MTLRRFAVVLGVVCVLASYGCAGSRSAVTPLRKADRIVFLGDSITAGAGGKTGFITLIRSELDARHKDLGIDTVNAGISGHKVPNLQARLDKDVIAKKPTIVFIYIGINDVWHWRTKPDGTMAGGTPKDAYEAGLKDLIARINQAGARVILCTPTVIGEKPDGTNERDPMLEEYAAISRKVAGETGSQLLDLRKAFIEYLKVHNKEGKPKGILTGDSVHLNAQGNRLVADEMLAALGVTPAK
ncbi:MAG TPA: SGNH/GDSL hydrolase family protein [Phycisphaerae bacterium]|nr:SGNH/GDSL hydrolase family protein [Phycisphaerae bacterium]